MWFGFLSPYQGPNPFWMKYEKQIIYIPAITKMSKFFVGMLNSFRSTHKKYIKGQVTPKEQSVVKTSSQCSLMLPKMKFEWFESIWWVSQ